jgi:mRNA deadenylase 3'-5' endonuclease subunit Ccr4
MSLQLHKYAKDYAGVPPAELQWSRRLGHMLQEIRRHAPDVLALQEVDRLSDFLGPLSKLGCVHSCYIVNPPADGVYHAAAAAMLVGM